ncbi:MAG: protease complex subunit PrcB family protein [Firmicutes bacterium]|nr:protease complex subunit PrcB family protein [Bacillota bacterium]
MNERLKIFLTGLLSGIVLVTTVGFSTLGEIKAQVAPVRYLIQGQEVHPSDRAHYYFNGKTYVPASLIYAGTTYLPLRFVAEMLGFQLDWNQETETISVMKPPAENTVVAYPRQISVNNLTKATAPREIVRQLDYSLGTELAQSYSWEGNTYIMVTRGACPTGGYSVLIKQALETEEEIVVAIEYRDPAPDAIVTQAITYPYALAVLEGTDKPVRFENVEGTYLPQLYGLEQMESITAESKSIKLLAPAIEKDASLTVRGIARVFEATVNWRLIGPDGEEKEKGFVTAARGGPDWGYFSFELTSEYLVVGNRLQVFEQSAKDGSTIHLVEIPLDVYKKLAQS